MHSKPFLSKLARIAVPLIAMLLAFLVPLLAWAYRRSLALACAMEGMAPSTFFLTFDVPYQSLIKIFLSERIKKELQATRECS
jgi:hypothetical protein